MEDPMADGTDAKLQFLKSHGALHRHPHRVRDKLFADSKFFDPRDLVQVRYEMLRRHRAEKQKVAQVARAFGVSRQFFYQLDEAFAEQGMAGLLPRKRGPKHPRKCSREIVQFLIERRAAASPMSWSALTEEVHRRFSIRLHPRSLQRALAAGKKTQSMKPTVVLRHRKPGRMRLKDTRHSAPSH
jgi:transposase